tara:strand:+ start:635 stop:769 length:135 start_codon:yes stop_codon:yes gene_type:complete
MKLGDLIERITYYTGIKWLVNQMFGDGCGCKERQEQYNDIELWD